MSSFFALSTKGKRTNHQNKGLISADRGTKATLMRTIPCSLFKSSTKDLSLPIFELVIRPRLRAAIYLMPTRVSRPCYDMKHARGRALCLCMEKHWESSKSPLFSMDSGLEAFSRNPTHGSFSALTFQSTEFAKYVIQRFLSY